MGLRIYSTAAMVEMHVVLIGLLLKVFTVGVPESDALLITNSNYRIFTELSKNILIIDLYHVH
jgi:hypothetical protein